MYYDLSRLIYKPVSITSWVPFTHSRGAELEAWLQSLSLFISFWRMGMVSILAKMSSKISSNLLARPALPKNLTTSSPTPWILIFLPPSFPTRYILKSPTSASRSTRVMCLLSNSHCLIAIRFGHNLNSILLAFLQSRISVTKVCFWKHTFKIVKIVFKCPGTSALSCTTPSVVQDCTGTGPEPSCVLVAQEALQPFSPQKRLK